MKLPESLEAKLSRVARHRDQTKSEVVHEALERFLSGGGASDKFVSALELAGDLVRTVEGPEDLSTNPKYLEGFGK